MVPLASATVRDKLEFQTLIPQSPAAALDTAILHRPARLNMDQPDLFALAPVQEVAAGQLRSIITTNRFRTSWTLKEAHDQSLRRRKTFLFRPVRTVEVLLIVEAGLRSTSQSQNWTVYRGC